MAISAALRGENLVLRATLPRFRGGGDGEENEEAQNGECRDRQS